MSEAHISAVITGLSARISDGVKQWVDRSPEQQVVVEVSGSWTYRQLGLAIEEARSWLSNSGVRSGDRVVIVCENCRALIAILFGLMELDAWPVLVNANLSAREVDQIRDHCGARRLIYTVSVSPNAAEHAKRHRAVIVGFADVGPIGLGPLNEGVEPEPLDEDIASRVAVLIYTSGTTGIPKGVMLSHRNLLFVAAVSAKIRSLTPADRFYCALPLSHVVGFSSVLLPAIFSGATVCLSPRFDPMTARAVMEKERVTVLLGVPSMFAQFLRYSKLRKLDSLDIPSLRVISCSGAPLSKEIKSATEKLFGLVLNHSYGVTECSPNISQTRIESPRTDTSVGSVIPGIEVKLVGPDRKPVANSDVGELWVRGPNVMKGYYRAPEETAAAVDEEGWFNTRDLARSEDGNLFIVGRTKDLIVRFGFNVYPAEVEGVLSAHPAVAQAAVVGRSVEGNEEVVAFVQLLPGLTATPRELAEHAASQLAPYKCPSEIIFLSAMPITTTGKIAKAELIKIAPSSSLAR